MRGCSAELLDQRLTRAENQQNDTHTVNAYLDRSVAKQMPPHFSDRAFIVAFGNKFGLVILVKIRSDTNRSRSLGTCYKNGK